MGCEDWSVLGGHGEAVSVFGWILIGIALFLLALLDTIGE
jgi:hypothetical protein